MIKAEDRFKVTVNLNKKYDSEIIEYLKKKAEVEVSINQYLIRLIKDDMKWGQEENR